MGSRINEGAIKSGLFALGALSNRDSAMACACIKIRYPNPTSALAALHRLAARCGDTKHPRYAYPCRECHGWHLTSAEPRRRALRWPHL